MSQTAQIEFLSDKEHIRRRPGMYIGSTRNPDHLFQEVLDNSLDELINGYANEINIDFPDDNHVIITDNGRGIPLHKIVINEKEQDSIIVACTVLKSGSKFNNSAYSMSIGLHGIGLVAVNTLSSYMRVSVKNPDTKKVHDYVFNDAELIDQNIIDYKVDWSTRIEFVVDPQFFTSSKFSKELFRERLRLVQANFPQAKFRIDGHELPSITLQDFVKNVLDLDNNSTIYRVNLQTNQIQLRGFISYDLEGVQTPNVKGDVNLRMCSGVYLTNFTTAFSNAILNEFKNKISKNEIQHHLRCYVNLFIQNPEFDSQAKGNMSKNISHLLYPLEKQFEQIAKTNLIRSIVETLIDKKSLKKAARKITKKKRVGPDNPLKDCLNIPGKVLYIMEGESADGTLDPNRDKYTEAILPISGKILNVANASIEKAVDSKKFKFLLEALGIDLSKKSQTYRYEKVKILCDADPDGQHIAVLLIIGLWYYARPLIEQRRVSIILPPLNGITKGNTFIPLYTPEDVAKYPGENIQRFKGLGEMNPSQLKVIVKDHPVEYIVQPPANKKEADNVIRCITDTELKRRLCVEKSTFNFNRLFSTITNPNGDQK